MSSTVVANDNWGVNSALLGSIGAADGRSAKMHNAKNTKLAKATWNRLRGCRWDARNGNVSVGCLAIRFEVDTCSEGSEVIVKKSVARNVYPPRRNPSRSFTTSLCFSYLAVPLQPRISSFRGTKGAEPVFYRSGNKRSSSCLFI